MKIRENPNRSWINKNESPVHGLQVNNHRKRYQIPAKLTMKMDKYPITINNDGQSSDT